MIHTRQIICNVTFLKYGPQVVRFSGCMYGTQSHKKYSPVNSHCLEEMFTNSNFEKNYPFILLRVISLIKRIIIITAIIMF